MTNAGDREHDASPPPGPAPDGTPSSSSFPPFSWPPRRLPEPEQDALLRPGRWRTAGAGAEDADEALRGDAASSGTWLDQVERHWLGRTSETFLDRARVRGWAPDEPGGYCPRCGSRVGLYEIGTEGLEAGQEPDPVGGCGSCERRRLPWSRVVRLGDYAGLLRRAVHELKFRRWRPVGLELGALLGASLAVELRRAGVPPAACRLVPVPTPWWRRVARGVDHTQVLARAASRVCGAAVVAGLGRKWRPSQLSVAGSERRQNVRGSFRAKGGLPGGVRVVVVIDDVRTTGATMMEACRALRRGWGGGKKGGDGAGLFDLWTAPVAVARTRRRPLAWSGGEGGESGGEGRES